MKWKNTQIFKLFGRAPDFLMSFYLFWKFTVDGLSKWIYLEIMHLNFELNIMKYNHKLDPKTNLIVRGAFNQTHL